MPETQARAEPVRSRGPCGVSGVHRTGDLRRRAGQPADPPCDVRTRRPSHRSGPRPHPFPLRFRRV